MCSFPTITILCHQFYYSDCVELARFKRGFVCFWTRYVVIESCLIVISFLFHQSEGMGSLGPSDQTFAPSSMQPSPISSSSTSPTIWTPGNIAASIFLFIFAGLLEIGGGWLVWRGVREHQHTALFLAFGSLTLVAYGLYLHPFYSYTNFHISYLNQALYLRYSLLILSGGYSQSTEASLSCFPTHGQPSSMDSNPILETI